MPSYQIVEVRTLHLWARLVTGLKRTPTLLPRSLQGALIVYNFHQVLKAGGKTTQPYQFVSPYQIVSTVKGLYSLKSYQIVHPSQLPRPHLHAGDNVGRIWKDLEGFGRILKDLEGFGRIRRHVPPGSDLAPTLSSTTV